MALEEFRHELRTGERLSDMDYARGRGFTRIVSRSGLEALENEIAGMIAMC